MASIGEAVAGYIKLRDARDKLRDRHKEELAPFNEKMMLIENFILKTLNDEDSDSISINGVGTAFKSTRTSAKVQDWDETLTYILENDLKHMLEKRVSKAAVEEFIEANGEAPPGVAITREVTVNIRRK